MGDVVGGETLRGLICTFYSYKGGVGRSMALANVAMLLSRWGQRVLVVDWDLEAPGLEKYFVRPDVRLARDTPGMLDIITGYAPGKPLAWRDGLLHVPPAIYSDTPTGLPQGVPIDILHAGQRRASYLDRLGQLDWRALFDNDLGSALEDMRTEWQDEYKFILIDSRTGLTDIGGICTILLPDYVLAMFTANEQSLEGISETMQRVQSLQANLPLNRSRVATIPIPARDESNSEYQRAAEWRQRFADALSPFYRDWIPTGQSAYRVLDYLKIPSIPFWSFGEQLPVLSEATDNPKNLAYSYGLIARLIFGRLDWSEVREGGQKAMQEEARQAAAAEQRSLAARQLSEQARQAELKRAEERLERLRSGVDWRWEQLIVRAKQDAERTSRNALLLLSFNIAITAVFVFGFTALAVFEFSGPDIPGKRHIFDTSFFIPAGVIGSLLYCFWAFHFLVVRVAARRARRAFLGLERERANFEAGVGVYAGPEDEASIRRFAAQIEMIVADEVAKTVPSQPAPERQISLSIESPTTSTQITGVADTVTVSSATPVAPAPPAALDNVSDKASAPLVPADVVIWYQPAPLITEWIAQFKLLFQALLGDVLGREPILWDITGSEAAAALRKAGAAKQHRPVSLVIVTRRLLSSEWMGSFARDLNLEGGPGAPPIIPITLDRTALSEIKELARYLSIDFSDLLYVGEAFTKSERYLDFQDRIRRVAASVAELLQQDGPYA